MTAFEIVRHRASQIQVVFSQRPTRLGGCSQGIHQLELPNQMNTCSNVLWLARREWSGGFSVAAAFRRQALTQCPKLPHPSL